MHEGTNHARVKDPFKVKTNRFNITVQRVHFYGFGVHISTNPKYLERLLKYFFLYYLHIYMRPDFLHILQQKQHTIECRSAYEKPAVLRRTLKRLFTGTMPLLSLDLFGEIWLIPNCLC